MTGALERAAFTEPLSPARAGVPGRRRPHALVHPVDGQVHWYGPLAWALGPGWSCYGLRTDTGPALDAGIGAMAARYTERLRHAEPRGPYTVTGWSFGAVVAFAMARLLEDAGQDVEQLVLIDPPPLPARPGSGALGVHLSRLLPGRDEEEIGAALAAVTARPAGDRADALAHVLGLTDGFTLRRLAVLVGHHHALDGWMPAGTVERLLLVQPSATAAQGPGGWLAHGRTARHAVVPGDHHTLLDGPALPVLADLYTPGAERAGDMR
ncbi:thioesterase domain-containing protein [Streptomyces sp. NPDC088789]|uniref:thioesterase domain-containing protein n=1 Tax=Streptomyces sp. NPDC088789 TaxID=3365899 RepID=UPI0037F89E76